MSILTTIWSLGAGASLILGIIHVLIFLRQGHDKRCYSNFWIFVAAISVTCTAIFEIILFNSQSIETWEWAVRLIHFTTGMVVIALVWYLATDLGTMRRWLAWAITDLWGFSFLINCWPAHGIVYREITNIKRITLAWGESFSTVEGIVNPWKFLADVASLLFVFYIIDGGIRLYRQGQKRRSLTTCGSTLFFILLAGIHTPLVDSAIIVSPTIISLSFLGIVLVIGLQQANNVIKLETLARHVASKDKRWENLLKNIELAVISFDGQGKMTYVNPFYEKLTGFTRDSIQDKSIKDLLAPSEVPKIEERFKRMETEGPRPHSEWTLRCADDSERCLAWSSVPIYNDEGRFDGILSVGEDITDRLKAEQALIDEKERMDVILSALDTGMVLIDQDLNVTWMNDKLRSLIPQGDPIGQKCYSFSEKLTSPCEDCGAQKAFKDKQVHTALRYSEPQDRWFNIISQPVIDKDGTVTHVLESVTDFTEKVQSRKNLEDALTEVTKLRDQLEAENTYLKQEIQAANNFEHMIGDSKPLKYVWHRIRQVAETGTTVLIEGETGTGKELVARAIHARSSRANAPLIKVNCASLPANLIESELFGHEKGAFTGATQKRRGHFELAHKGTIFLDEIGELPLETQAKLLSVLEDSTFVRVGSEKPRPLDVRIIAATNRDLEAEVKAGQFRRDLYYRLNVYSLTIPPLRERCEDIPLLAQHFMEQFAKQQGKTVTQISKQTMDRLTSSPWPGNVRELRNIIERAIIASDGTDLSLPGALLLSNTKSPPAQNAIETATKKLQSLQNVQRDHILHILRHTQGKLEGKGGAADILDVNPSTLRNRMKKLGIGRDDI